MTSTTQNKTIFQNKGFRKILAAVFWIGLWQLAYLTVKQEILIVSPVRVLQRLFELSQSTEFWLTAFLSMLRILEGFLLGVIFGCVLAVLTSVSRMMYEIFYPVISIIKATPVASFIILALVWIPSPHVPSFTSFLMVTPIVWANVVNGIKKTDRNLLQMAAVYRFGLARTVKRIYLPSAMPYFTAACTTGMGLAWKAGIAAEVLAVTPLSIGRQIYNSKIYIETDNLFAWTVVVIGMSVVLEFLMVRLMKKVGEKYNVVQ
ncbi:ABC transporter permease [Caproiciproducens faecalis]|uniref:ABC transporter permease subunit n=1 Tax=Caproiciproducens faecalis TaxID=2820301 RepID=A0ABS7DRM0_9FIRM|nr:ABC transporter permease subunit [Caproiciproducens faecalis]MBW7573945.1 ABC transporter permease subunit [Caproiciproducens faecalis]